MTYVLLESLRPSGNDHLTLRLMEPEKILRTSKLHEVIPILEELESAVKSGYMAIGFLSYEAGFALLPGMPFGADFPFPLIDPSPDPSFWGMTDLRYKPFYVATSTGVKVER